MNNFSIKDIEMLSGIKAHTFRVWEQRHGLCFCKRKNSQHRYYDNDDLKAVLRIAFLYHRGYKISKIAMLSKEEIVKLASVNMEDLNYDSYVYQLVEATMDYDQQRFERIVLNSIIYFGFEKSIIRVFYPFMQKIGLLWVTEHVIPAQEHFSSSLILQKILIAIDRLSSLILNQKETVLIFAPEGEYHEIPLLIALYILKKGGIKTVYFGADVPMAQLEYYCRYKSVTHFYLHLITNFLNKDVGEYLNKLAEKYPAITIIASGPALKSYHNLPSSVKIVLSMEALIPCINQ